MNQKKGLPWFAWVGIGCGVLLLLIVVAVGGLGLFVGKKVQNLAEDFEDRPVYTTAAAIARFNPEIELVKADEERETVTMRNVETGETMTFDLADIKSGNFSFEKDGERVDITSDDTGLTVQSQDGTTRIGASGNNEMPDWVPVPRGARVESGYSSTNDSQSSGLAQLKDYDSGESVLEFYRSELRDAGFDVSNASYNSGDDSVSSVTAQKRDPQRTITIVFNEAADGEEAISINYSGKN